MVNIYFWRQVFILCGTLLHSLSAAFMISFPAVLNPAITSPNSTDIKTTKDHASWIGSINGIGGLFGSILLAVIMEIMGRKHCFNTTNYFYLLGWIIFPFAQDIVTLYVARFVQGISIGSPYMICMVISEYVHPSRRGYFIALNKVVLAAGILCCHAMSAVCTWRLIAVVAAVPGFLAVVFTFFWPESPSYLALKGRFSESEVAFKWLNGDSEESMRNLKSLIETQKEMLEKKNEKSSSLLESVKKSFRRDFVRAVLICTLLTLSVDFCGRYYIAAYVIQIMMELLDSKTSALYFTLGVDLFVLTATSLATVIISYARRRTILLSSGVTVAFLMLFISVLVYLKSVYTFPASALWLIASMIIIQCFVASIGLIPVAFALIGEIFPLAQKSLGILISGCMFTSLYFLSLKVTPVLMDGAGLHGTYAIYGIGLAICLVYLFYTVPETKDRTLQDIEDEMKGQGV